MKLYRFSPIQTEEELFKAIEYIHVGAHKLCNQSFGKYLPVTGSLAIFTHYPEEFEFLTKTRESLTEEENYNKKYFKLINPIHFETKNETPEATYQYLYIRKPDPYRSQVGDIDFVLESKEQKKLKARLDGGESISGIRSSPENYLELIELYDPDIDVLSYIDKMTMEELIKKQSNS